MNFHHLTDNYIEELQEDYSKNYRRYITPDGNKYPSITTILGAQDKPGIDEWRKAVGDKQADHILRQASARGTRLHDALEKYVANDEEYSKSLFSIDKKIFKEMRKYIDGRVNNVRHQEVALYSDKLQIAGRCDLIAEYDGVLSIIDYKTSRKTKKREWITDYFIQGSFYSCAYYEMTNIPISQTVIIIGDDLGKAQCFIEHTYPYIKDIIRIRKMFSEKSEK